VFRSENKGVLRGELNTIQMSVSTVGEIDEKSIRSFGGSIAAFDNKHSIRNGSVLQRAVSKK
jgi:hypothetical protein